MRIVFIGCIKFSYVLLEKLLTLEGVEVVGIITKTESAFNSDFKSLVPLAEKHKIPCRVDPNPETWIKDLNPDVIYCFGWSYLLGPEILKITRLGVIGYHPAALPQNRGRHPIIWALALGLSETASTFFFMNERADSGDILSQEIVYISQEDNAESLYEKLIQTALKQLDLFTWQLREGAYIRAVQSETEANSWRKRSEIDGVIDWRMSAKNIYNLVRALAPPYPGATYKDQKIFKTEIVKNDQRNIEPGKVLYSGGMIFIVKCGEDALRVILHEFCPVPKKDDYLPFSGEALTWEPKEAISEDFRSKTADELVRYRSRITVKEWIAFREFVCGRALREIQSNRLIRLSITYKRVNYEVGRSLEIEEMRELYSAVDLWRRGWK